MRRRSTNAGGGTGAREQMELAWEKGRVTAKVYKGDCVDVLPRRIPAGSVDLIVTSPPYADRRKSTYGGISPDKYVEWFMPRAAAFQECLAPTGSFILNIKELADKGERHPYVLELILAMRKQGWRWVEEYCWHKKNCYPGKWPNRFRDAWERLLHFTINKDFKMRQEAVMVPMGDWKHARLNNLSKTDKTRDNSRVDSGFGKKVENWVGRDMAYPTNVLRMATECGNQNHSAAFPKELPSWFIKLFTDKGDTVLDPFAGSGTTLIAARELKRNSIGVEVQPEYCSLIRKRVAEMRGDYMPKGARRQEVRNNRY